MEDSKAMATPMSMTTALNVAEEGEHMGQKEYRSMIGSLHYLTVMRPDIQFSVCLCDHFQESPRTSHRQEITRIFRYLHHTPDFGLWYSTSSSLTLHGFLDVDFAWCWLDRKSSFSNLLWCLGLPANSRVLLNPLPRQSMLLQLVVLSAPLDHIHHE
jgi:hypothetical protein